MLCASWSPWDEWIYSTMSFYHDATPATCDLETTESADHGWDPWAINSIFLTAMYLYEWSQIMIQRSKAHWVFVSYVGVYREVEGKENELASQAGMGEMV